MKVRERMGPITTTLLACAFTVVALSLTLAVVESAPHGQNQFVTLYGRGEDTVFNNYNELAPQVNRHLSTVPRLDFFPGNENIERKFEEEQPPPPPPMQMGPWMRYRQTYYNPFYYGGPNGPATFVPQFGVWPTYKQGGFGAGGGGGGV